MSNCHLCGALDVGREAIIELLKLPPVKTEIVFQTNPSLEWRARIAICATCFIRLRMLPLESEHIAVPLPLESIQR